MEEESVAVSVEYKVFFCITRSIIEMSIHFLGDVPVFQVTRNRIKPHRGGTLVDYIQYPLIGKKGRPISAVVIFVNQTSNDGTARIIRGGIKRHYVKIILEAYHSLSMNYTAIVYSNVEKWF